MKRSVIFLELQDIVLVYDGVYVADVQLLGLNKLFIHVTTAFFHVIIYYFDEKFESFHLGLHFSQTMIMSSLPASYQPALQTITTTKRPKRESVFIGTPTAKVKPTNLLKTPTLSH